MIYHFTLKAMGLAAGLALVILSLPGLFAPAPTQRFARALPRSRTAGIFLLTIALIWSFWLLATMEMGEFAPFRKMLLIGLPIGFVLVVRFVDEFLAVRALGILCLLAAEPLLDAAFLRYEGARLLVTAFAYVLVVVGLFWVTMPYILRNQVDWSAQSNSRWRLVHSVGAFYGAVLLVLAVAFY